MARKIVMLCFVPVLIGAAAVTGLTGGADRDVINSSLTVTIQGACGLTVTGDYDYGTLPPGETGTQTRSVTVHVWCNIATYRIDIRANGPVQLGGSPATDITLASFHYTGTSGDTALTLDDRPFFAGTRTAGRDHLAEMRLVNLTGMESPGTYSTTVTFTMVAPAP